MDLYRAEQGASLVGVRIEGAEVILFPDRGRPLRWTGGQARELSQDEAGKLGWLLGVGQRWVATESGDVVAKGSDPGPSSIALEFLASDGSDARTLLVEDLVRFCGSESSGAIFLGAQVLSSEGVGLRTDQGLTVRTHGGGEEYALPVADRYLSSSDGRWQILLQEKDFRLFRGKLGGPVDSPLRPRTAAFSPDGSRLVVADAKALHVFRLNEDGGHEDQVDYTLSTDLVSGDDEPPGFQSTDILDTGSRVAAARLEVIRRPRRGPDGSLVRGSAKVFVEVLDGDRRQVLVRNFTTDRWDHRSPRVRLAEDGSFVIVVMPGAAYAWMLR